MAEVVLSSCGEAAGTPRKRSREPPGSEFQTPVTKRLRAAPGSPNSPKNSQNSPSSEQEERQEKEVLPRRLEIPAGNTGIPQNSQLSVGAFYGKRIYLDPLERKRLRELLGEGNSMEKIGNSGKNPGNSGRNLENSNRNSGKNLGNSGKNPGNSSRNFGRNSGNSGRNSSRNSGNSSRNSGNSSRNFGNSNRNLENSGKNSGNSGKNSGNSGRNLGNSNRNFGNSGGNCSSKGKADLKDQQEIPKGNSGNSGNGNFGNSGNSKVGFRVLSVGVRPPLRLPLGSSFFLSGKRARKKSPKNPLENSGKENRECSKGQEGIPRKNPLEKSLGQEEIPRKNPLENSGEENWECSKGQEEIPRKNPLEKSGEENQECSKEEIPRKSSLEKSRKENQECSKGEEEIPRKSSGNVPGKEEPPGISHSQDSLSPKNDSGSSCPAGLFPIFLPSRRRPLEELPAPFGPSGKAPKKTKDLISLDQLIIDAGQRELGAGQCGSCGMIFAPGIPEDRLQHLRHHRRLREGLRYLGWKQQRVVAEFWDGKIVLILPGDPKYALRKAQEVLEVVDSELGFPGSSLGSFPDNSRIYLFVGTGKCVLGCLVAESIQQAFRVLPEPDPSPLPDPQDPQDSRDSQNPQNSRDPCLRAWRCSPSPEGAVCGVSRLWVLGRRRRRGIARRMADTLRHTFVFGAVLNPGDLAFSAPTADGRAFAERYCGRQDFLVYSFLGNAVGSSGSMGSSVGSMGSSVGSSGSMGSTGSAVGSSSSGSS